MSLNLRPDILAAHMAMLIFSLLVSVSYTSGALVANQIEPLSITAVRFLLATIFISIFFFYKCKDFSFRSKESHSIFIFGWNDFDLLCHDV